MIIYLYIKQHSITKLKYFGKTTQPNPFKYRGSGTKWLNHINKHGKDHVVTLEVWGFDDPTICTDFALSFSTEHRIVESVEWANQIPEDGKNGMPRNSEHRSSYYQKVVASRRTSSQRKGYTWHSPETRQKIGEGCKNPSPATLEKMKQPKSATQIEKMRRKKKLVTCPQCDKTGGSNLMKRYHFDNCKLRIDN
jgi:hypothetical protein